MRPRYYRLETDTFNHRGENYWGTFVACSPEEAELQAKRQVSQALLWASVSYTRKIAALRMSRKDFKVVDCTDE